MSSNLKLVSRCQCDDVSYLRITAGTPQISREVFQSGALDGQDDTKVSRDSGHTQHKAGFGANRSNREVGLTQKTAGRLLRVSIIS